MELYQHDTDSLREELERREAKDPRHDALVKALRAAAYAVENPPYGFVHENQLDKASKLVFELVYQCLPGGTQGGFDATGKYDPPSGMDAGWLHAFGITPPRGRKFITKVTAVERDEVLALLSRDYRRGGL